MPVDDPEVSFEPLAGVNHDDLDCLGEGFGGEVGPCPSGAQGVLVLEVQHAVIPVKC